jgi:hypothetical protein
MPTTAFLLMALVPADVSAQVNLLFLLSNCER